MARSVLVTGGNRGIGLAIARALGGGRRQRRDHPPVRGAARGPLRRPLRRHRHRPVDAAFTAVEEHRARSRCSSPTPA